MKVIWEQGDLVVRESGEQLLVGSGRFIEPLTPDSAAELAEILTTWALEMKAQEASGEGNIPA